MLVFSQTLKTFKIDQKLTCTQYLIQNINIFSSSFFNVITFHKKFAFHDTSASYTCIPHGLIFCNLTQRAHGAMITSLWRQNVVTFWRHNDVVASYVRWVIFKQLYMPVCIQISPVTCIHSWGAGGGRTKGIAQRATYAHSGWQWPRYDVCSILYEFTCR